MDWKGLESCAVIASILATLNLVVLYEQVIPHQK